MSYTKRYIDNLMEQGIDVLHDNLEDYTIMLDAMYEYHETIEKEKPNKNKKK